MKPLADFENVKVMPNSTWLTTDTINNDFKGNIET